MNFSAFNRQNKNNFMGVIYVHNINSCAKAHKLHPLSSSDKILSDILL